MGGVNRPQRNVGDRMQCEAHDLVPTKDDAIDIRCPRMGRVIREDMGGGRMRLRSVCEAHGSETAWEVN